MLRGCENIVHDRLLGRQMIVYLSEFFFCGFIEGDAAGYSIYDRGKQFCVEM